MADPSELLSVARFLSGSAVCASPTDAHLRRAVSTACYAVFHGLSRAAASRFMGASHQNTADFASIYRAFNHADMSSIFEALAKTTLSDKYRTHFRRSALSQDMRDFADAFPSLQASRHLADYDPFVRFSPSDVEDVINHAEIAIETVDRVPEAERTDVLALLLSGSRN